MTKEERQVQRLEAAQRLKEIDERNQTGFVIYIWVKKLGVVKKTSKKGNEYDAVDLGYITFPDGAYRHFDKKPAFTDEGKELLSTLEKDAAFRVVVDKRNGEQYWNWYDIEKVDRKVAATLSKLLPKNMEQS